MLQIALRAKEILIFPGTDHRILGRSEYKIGQQGIFIADRRVDIIQTAYEITHDTHSLFYFINT